jgi:hypothetical protein
VKLSGEREDVAGLGGGVAAVDLEGVESVVSVGDCHYPFCRLVEKRVGAWEGD